MKKTKNIKALLLSLSLSLTAVCALPASETRAETSKELIVSETPTGSEEMDTTGTEAVTMYRLYNPNSGEHLYTKDASEKSRLVREGWGDEGIGWIAPEKSNTPVYRLYNPNAGDHHYTTGKIERDYLISIGWNDEGIGWYSDDAKTVPLYREYNPNAVTGTHNYTTDKNEHDYLVSIGWDDEDIGWYAVRDGKTDPPKTPDDETLKVGDIVILGTYEQDNDLTNGPEPIEWKYVADRDGHKYLLSKYALDGKPYEDTNENIAWEGCKLRKWLNEDFYNEAFSAADKKKIVTAHNEDPDSYELYKDWYQGPCGAVGGNATDDNVFLMSWTEARDYLDGKLWIPALRADNYNQRLLCRPTAYAMTRTGSPVYDGSWFYPFSDGYPRYPSDMVGCCQWWLRSPGYSQEYGTAIYFDGSIKSGVDCPPHLSFYIRPAILID